MTPRTLRLGQALVLAGVMSAAVAAPATSRTYIVQLRSAPVATYGGGIAGLPATQVPEGDRLHARAPAVLAYQAHLARERRAVLATVGAPVKLVHEYGLAFNGFAAVLSDAQAARLRANGKVLTVVPDEQRQAVTITTPHFLGLDAAGGLWSQLRHGSLDKGEDIIVAVVDSGIQPENTAFYDQVDGAGVPVKSGGTLAYGPPPSRWLGSCTTGPGFAVGSCNNKLIGAKVFSAGLKAAVEAGSARLFFGDFVDVPRDEIGHGTHTLATAGGNANAPAYTDAGVLVGATSGMAPRARLATYKALFGLTDPFGVVTGSGFTSDLVAAIDAAVADGVDVINYSVSGSATNLLDPVEVAFLNAGAAGVFVAAAAGNSGPANAVDHNSPWLTTVAASTHDRQFIADLGLGNGSSYTGASFTPGPLPTANMVLSSDIPAAGVPPTQANLCMLNSLDAAKAAGKIVVCDRGTNARVEKSAEVQRAGGVGMVLINVSQATNNLVADFHSVPSVHLPLENRSAVRGYVTSTGKSSNGHLSARYQAPGVVAPVMASFSSRGPNLAEPSVMKPEITAPGVDVIAAFAFNQTTQAEHDAILNGTLVPTPLVSSLQGTSMATPHIAGIAALLRQAHPKWSPSAIKSAIVTTAGTVKLADGSADPDRYGYGAGHINPNAAGDPGLVYPTHTADYNRFLCSANWLPADNAMCQTLGYRPPSDLNLPTVSADVPGTLVVRREVRNVSGGTSSYSATASVPGFDVTVSPSTLPAMAPGETRSFSVTLKANGAVVGNRVFGTLTWQDGSHTVTSPVQARWVELAAPALLSSGSTDGARRFRLGYGFDGATSAVVAGLKAATRTAGTVKVKETVCVPVSVPGGALTMRAALYNADTSGQGADDLDLRLLDPAGNVVASSGGPTADEMVSLNAPAAGTYQACVDGFAPKGGSSDFTLSTWVLSGADAGGTLVVTGLPATVVAGDTARPKASWAGLVAGTRYLGGIRYAKGDGSTVGMTLLTVEPDVVAQTLRGPVAAQRSKGRTRVAR